MYIYNEWGENAVLWPDRNFGLIAIIYYTLDIGDFYVLLKNELGQHALFWMGTNHNHRHHNHNWEHLYHKGP